VIGLLVVIALVVVALSGAAGWTSGLREASSNATATQNAVIDEQLGRIPADIASGNTVLLEARLRALVTLTPGVPGIPEIAATATALFQTVNATPTATMLSQMTPTPGVTAEPTREIIVTQAGGGYDLAGLLQQAQAAAASSQWQDAIDLLDVILGADPAFQPGTVRALMSQALNAYALQLYQAGQPAAANIIVGRAEEFGPLANGLAYERQVAEVYLTARAAAGVNYTQAIQSLRALLNYGPGRYYQEAQQMLYDQYVSYGDAFVAEGNQCSAAAQYQNAMSIFGSGAANGKYNSANTLCIQGTPTVDPFFTPSVPENFAPLGVVATQPGG
jgi:tetratricopeptide (TPR) repeat protein